MIRKTATYDLEMAIRIPQEKSVSVDYFPNKDVFVLGAIVLGWYTTAIVAITTSKQILNAIPLPFSLCFSQFLCASIITRILLQFYPSRPIARKNRSLVIQIAVSYTLGFIFTNVAFSFANANFAETIKSGEPVSSVILGYFIINEVSSRLTYATLIPICIGVALSCFGESDFNMYGFVFAGLSNFCFSYRAVVAKQLYISIPDRIDEIRLFADISLVGLIIMCIVSTFEWNSWSQMNWAPNWNLFGLCAVNGCAYSAYNLLSFMALSKSTIMTHAVLNVFRRVVIISFTAMYFSVQLNVLNITGVAIAVAGVMCFTLSKQTKSPQHASCITGYNQDEEK
jgi:solute carrier family 35, member E1